MRTPIPITSAAFLVALTACGGGESDAPATPETDGATEAPEETQGAAEEDGDDQNDGTAPGSPLEGTFEVGDTFQFQSANQTGHAEITWDAIDWVETTDGQQAAILAFTVDATDSPGEIEHYYNTAGTNGWYYVDGDMVATSYLDMYTSWNSVVYGHDMPGGEFVAPGTVGTDRTMIAVTGNERGGTYAYAEDSLYLINLDIPEESVNAEDNETIQGIHERAADSGGVYFESWSEPSGDSASEPEAAPEPLEDEADPSADEGAEAATEESVAANDPSAPYSAQFPSAAEVDFYGPMSHPNELLVDINTIEDCETASIIWGGLQNGDMEGFDIDWQYFGLLENWMMGNGCL